MTVVDWGLVDYETALKQQLEYVEKLRAGSGEDTIIFCSHPPVVTLGRKSEAQDVSGWQGLVVEVSRGGRATYHGPNQLVVYPVIDLRLSRSHLRPRDVHHYLSALEQIVIASLHEIGIQGVAGSLMDKTPSKDVSYTGVWVNDRKIASIGIGVKGWISYHGIAINLFRDPTAFRGINPCGFRPETMVSVEEILGHPPDVVLFKKIMTSVMMEKFAQ